jgi:hypothetical protein
MSRSHGIVIQNSFIGGLNTDVTGLSFPENSCTETDNCIFTNFGYITRRGPFDLEGGHEEYTVDSSGKVIVTAVWTNVAGEGDITFVVAQIGNDLHFYRASSQTALSSNKHATVLDMTVFAPSGVTDISTLECQFASGNGLLFVTNPRLNSFYVTYDVDTDSFSSTEIDIQTRDFEGDTTDALGDSDRPTAAIGALTAAHRYNLENQGWTAANLTAWDTAQTTMPSNCDVSWYFKDTDDKFDFTTVADRAVGNSLAPKGHYIYSLYDTDRSTHTSGATDAEIPLARVSNCTFFAGRVFYSGLNTLKQNSKIFFSQIVEAPTQYGKCYQTNDPTSETLFDLLPSDGGVIDIISAGNILKMMPMYSSLIVFCTNGIWQISGSDRLSFSATNYTVTRLATVQLVSHTAFIDVEGVPYWLSNEGVFTLSADQQSNALRVQCITDNKIRNFIIHEMLSESKQYARGVYDQFTKTVQWLYRSTSATGFNDRYVYDRILILNLITGGWYSWSISRENVKINGVVNIFSISGVLEPVNVIAGTGNQVIAGTGNNVVVISTSNTTGVGIVSVNKYLVNVDGDITFAEHFEDVTVKLDWASVVEDGEAYSSYFVTGYAVHGQAARKFQSNYVHMYSEVSQTEDLGYKILGRWNYSVAASTGKWTTSQIFDVFSNDYAQTVNINADSYKYKPNRIKLRGHGRACQFKVFNSGNKPFNIIGWTVFETANQWV